MKRIEFEKQAARGYAIMTIVTMIVIGLKGFFEYKNPKATLLGLAVGLILAVVAWFLGLGMTRCIFNFEDSESKLKKRFSNRVGQNNLPAGK